MTPLDALVLYFFVAILGTFVLAYLTQNFAAFGSAPDVTEGFKTDTESKDEE
jgi:hypothetical protein